MGYNTIDKNIKKTWMFGQEAAIRNNYNIYQDTEKVQQWTLLL